MNKYSSKLSAFIICIISLVFINVVHADDNDYKKYFDNGFNETKYIIYNDSNNIVSQYLTYILSTLDVKDKEKAREFILKTGIYDTRLLKLSNIKDKVFKEIERRLTKNKNISYKKITFTPKVSNEDLFLFWKDILENKNIDRFNEIDDYYYESNSEIYLQSKLVCTTSNIYEDELVKPIKQIKYQWNEDKIVKIYTKEYDYQNETKSLSIVTEKIFQYNMLLWKFEYLLSYDSQIKTPIVEEIYDAFQNMHDKDKNTVKIIVYPENTLVKQYLRKDFPKNIPVMIEDFVHGKSTNAILHPELIEEQVNAGVIGYEYGEYFKGIYYYSNESYFTRTKSITSFDEAVDRELAINRAINHFNNAIKFGYKEESVYLLLIQLYLEMNEIDKALELSKNIKDKTNVIFKYYLSWIYYLKNDINKTYEINKELVKFIFDSIDNVENINKLSSNFFSFIPAVFNNYSIVCFNKEEYTKARFFSLAAIMYTKLFIASTTNVKERIDNLNENFIYISNFDVENDNDIELISNKLNFYGLQFKDSNLNDNLYSDNIWIYIDKNVIYSQLLNRVSFDVDSIEILDEDKETLEIWKDFFALLPGAIRIIGAIYQKENNPKTSHELLINREKKICDILISYGYNKNNIQNYMTLLIEESKKKRLKNPELLFGYSTINFVYNYAVFTQVWEILKKIN